LVNEAVPVAVVTNVTVGVLAPTESGPAIVQVNTGALYEQLHPLFVKVGVPE
jgi:hypothetical protein